MGSGSGGYYFTCSGCGFKIPEGMGHQCPTYGPPTYRTSGGMIPPGSYTTIPDPDTIYSMGQSGKPEPQPDKSLWAGLSFASMSMVPPPTPEPDWLKPIDPAKAQVMKNFTTHDLVREIMRREGPMFFEAGSPGMKLMTKKSETAEQIRQRERSGNDYCANPESYWSEDWDDHQ